MPVVHEPLQSAFDELVTQVASLPPAEGIAAAGRLVELVKRLEQRANRLRAESVARLADEEALTVSDVATRLGVSRQRASVILRVGRQEQAGRAG